MALKRWLKPRNLLMVLILLSAVLALRSLPLDAMWQALARLSSAAALALLALNLGIVSLFSVRWWLILRAQGQPVRLRSLVVYRLASFGVSYFTPGPQFGGEPVQVFALHSRHRLPAVDAVSSVTLDKLLELLANFTFLGVGMAVVIFSGVLPGWSSLPAGLTALVLPILPLIYLMALWAGRRPVSALAGVLSGWLPRLERYQKTALAAEAQVDWFLRFRTRALLRALAFSLLVWVIMAVEFALTLRLLGLEMSLPQVMALMTTARLAFLLPAPGGVGVVESGLMLAMQAMGFSPALGLAVSLVIRARDLLLASLGLWLAGMLTRTAVPDTALSTPVEGLPSTVSVMTGD